MVKLCIFNGKTESLLAKHSSIFYIRFRNKMKTLKLNKKEDFMTIHDKTVRFHRDKFLYEMSNETECHFSTNKRTAFLLLTNDQPEFQ